MESSFSGTFTNVCALASARLSSLIGRSKIHARRPRHRPTVCNIAGAQVPTSKRSRGFQFVSTRSERFYYKTRRRRQRDFRPRLGHLALPNTHHLMEHRALSCIVHAAD